MQDGDGHLFIFEEDLFGREIDGDFKLRVALDFVGEHLDVLGCGDDAGDAERRAIAEEDLSKAFSDHRAESVAIERLRGVLAGAPTAEIRAGKKNAGPLEPVIIQRVRLVGAIGVLANVIKGVFTETIEGDALHEARRDDAVGVDVLTRNVDGGAGDLGDFCEGHGAKNEKFRVVRNRLKRTNQRPRVRQRFRRSQQPQRP